MSGASQNFGSLVFNFEFSPSPYQNWGQLQSVQEISQTAFDYIVFLNHFLNALFLCIIMYCLKTDMTVDITSVNPK